MLPVTVFLASDGITVTPEKYRHKNSQLFQRNDDSDGSDDILRSPLVNQLNVASHLLFINPSSRIKGAGPSWWGQVPGELHGSSAGEFQIAGRNSAKGGHT